MTSMIIEYDLRSPGRNYDELYKAIKSYGVWAHITESTWFIKINTFSKLSNFCNCHLINFIFVIIIINYFGN